jgi:hypothetical protein
MGLENGVCINRTDCVIGFVQSLGGQREAQDERATTIAQNPDGIGDTPEQSASEAWKGVL